MKQIQQSIAKSNKRWQQNKESLKYKKVNPDWRNTKWFFGVKKEPNY